MWSNQSFQLTPSPLWPGVAVHDRIPSIRQIELLKHLTVSKQITDVKLNCQSYVAIFETILLSANKTLGVRLQYLNHLIVNKLMHTAKQNYLC